MLLTMLLIALAGPVLAQSPAPAPVVSYPFAAPARTAASTAAATEEVATIVAENPTLVSELLTVGDGDNDALISIYCLGPAAIDSLIPELDNDDDMVRTKAAMVLCYMCAHEDAPRSKVVKALLAQKAKRPAAEVGEMLVLVTRMTRPDFRASIRRTLEVELTGGLDGSPAVQACGPNGCPVPGYAPAVFVPESAPIDATNTNVFVPVDESAPGEPASRPVEPGR